MPDSKIHIIENKISRQRLQQIAAEFYTDLLKAVVDIEKGIMAIGGELHADEEALLLEQGSNQGKLWGINLYPYQERCKMVEFDSVINIRPMQNNRSRSVEDLDKQERIIQIVNSLVE